LESEAKDAEGGPKDEGFKILSIPFTRSKKPPRGGFFYERRKGGRTREEGLGSEAKDAEGGLFYYGKIFYKKNSS